MHIKPTKLVAGAMVVLCSMVGVVSADLDISWWTIDGGGKMSTTGGNFELSGTIGQPDAGEFTMTGGGLELIGGFWLGAAEPFCFGDLNGDNEVNLSDLAQLLSNYGTTGSALYKDGDLDGDGDVDLSDLAGLLGVYGSTCG